jgi:uncharacterized protein with beta-barrel porin domain
MVRKSGAWRFGALSLTALLLAGTAKAEILQTLGSGNNLVTINSVSPGTVARSVAITGIAAGTTLRGVDYRPASPRVLYAISNVGQLYAINARTGTASAIGTPAVPPIGGVALDFNPTVDRIRLITQTGQNARLNPDTGALAATDGALAYAATDANAGQVVTVAGAAYTNSVAGATSTTLYAIDTRSGLAAARLVTVGNATVSPNSGTLFTVGSTGVATATSVGFDISRDGVAYATLTNPTTLVTSLYTVNLTTGAATLVGVLSGNTTYDGLAVQLAPFSSMGVTANQAIVGAVLDNFTGLPSGGLLALFNGIDGSFGTPGAQAAALQALSPATFSSLPDLSLNAVEVQESGVLRYVRDLRGNGGMAGGSVATLDAAGKIGVWMTAGSRYGHYDSAADRPRVKSADAHILGGIDYRFMPAIAVGAYGGYASNDATLSASGSQGRFKSWFLGGYGTGKVGPAFVDAWGSYTDLKIDLTRRTTIGSFSDTAGSYTSGRIVSGGATAGLNLNAGMFEIEPFAAARYADVNIKGFGEVGGVTALNIGKLDRVSLRSELGARIGVRTEFMGATFMPQVRGGWYHEFRDQPRTINASFQAAAIATPFAFTTNPLRPNYYTVGAALNIAGKGPISMVADYDAQFDKDRRYNNFTIGLRIAL